MRNNKRKLYINKENKKLFGVCAGLADYMEVNALIVRMVFIVSVLFGAVFLVPAYFIFYFCLDSDTGDFKESVTDNPVFRHFKNVDYKKKLYRNEEKGKCLGICAGIADYLEIETTMVRIITVVLFLIAGPIPWVAYFAAYFLLDKKAPASLKSRFESAYSRFGSKAQSRTKQRSDENTDDKQQEQQQQQQQQQGQQPAGHRELRRCTRKFSNIHQRLVKMEAYVTSSRFKLHQDFKDIS